MAKQVVIAAMEEVFGEYILNMSKENLKIAALRGRIKLENVQLDGDMIGSHVLNALGLQSTSFGILSCSVQSVNIVIPWKSLEKDATKMILDGVHMLCVPLVPLTANQMYGAGTKSDPPCTLRTRLKRLLLSRIERNFWNGQMAADGGPPLKRIQRAVEDIKRSMQQKKKMPQQGIHSNNIDDNDDSLYDDNGEEWLFQNNGNDIPELPRDWKKKMTEKMLRNMEASMHNVHIRVELTEKGLDFNRDSNIPKQNTSDQRVDDEGADFQKQDLLPEERAFCFGFTLGSLVVRTANEEWKAGRHDTSNPLDGSQMSSVKGNLGPNEYVVKNNKIGYFSKLSFYWDQDPPLLLAETELFRGSSGKLVYDKWQSRIATAMQAMFTQQEPGKVIRSSLGASPPSALWDGTNDNYPHVYVCKDLDSEVRVRMSDRTRPGPMSCSADVVPFVWEFSLRPHQYKQYNLLRAAIQQQQRFDTMLRQRPSETPKENPKAWWQYAIACVTARPTSRPWKDVQIICRNRSRYIELVIKKNKHRIADNSVHSTSDWGFHKGLTDAESSELLLLEELLPLEALQAFHLLALRQVYQLRKQQQQQQTTPKEKTPEKSKLGIFFRFRKKKHRRQNSRGSVSECTQSSCEDDGAGTGTNNSSASEDDEPRRQNRGQKTTESRKQSLKSPADSQVSLMDAMTFRLGNKVWFVDWRLHNVSLSISMVVDDTFLASLNVKARGNVRSFGKGKRDVCFDVAQCDLSHANQRILFVKAGDDDFLTDLRASSEKSHTPSLSSRTKTPLWQNHLHHGVPTIQSLLRETPNNTRFPGEPNLHLASNFLELPPPGVACRIIAGMNTSTQKISISSHPATFLWTSSFLDGLQHFNKTHPDFGQYMRNAATPLARKAQLALASPGSRAIHLNIMAPKIWFPIVSSKSEAGGTLILDAGIARLQGEKLEGETDMTVQFRANDFQASLVRKNRGPLSSASNGGEFVFWNGQPAISTDTLVIHPFNVSVDLKTHTDNQLSSNLNLNLKEGPLRKMEIRISPICLNLVDAEVLARALGKWYASSVSRVSRHRERRRDEIEHPHKGKSGAVLQPGFDRTRQVSVMVEKVEIALEGHSKRRSEDCDRSLASLDSLHDFSPPTRTYLVEINAIEMNRVSHGLMAATRFLAQNASIVRLRDGTGHGALRKRRELDDTQYRILVRSNWVGRDDNSKLQQPVLRASLLHDGKNHLDEVEVDIDSVILRVTTTTLKDCVKAIRRVAEVAQIATREMERNIHEEGRKARKFGIPVGGRKGNAESYTSYDHPVSPFDDRPPSPTFSLLTDTTGPDNKPLLDSPKKPVDSSILFRVTLNESTLLAGRPTGAIFGVPVQDRNPRHTSFAVIQVLSSVLVMFQSIENPNGTGSKTLHVSVENISSLINTEFECVLPEQAPPMIGPTCADFRVVYSTENLGCVVSQDVSVDCDGLKICLTPNDFTIMRNISLAMFGKLREISVPEKLDRNPYPENNSRSLSSFARYQKKGTGIATNIRVEIQAISFVLLKAYKSYLGSPEFLNFCLSDLKGKLEGCQSALSGESSAQLSIMFFDTDTSSWEYAMEPVQVVLEVDQMPNDLVLRLSGKRMIQLNLTSVLLRDLADMRFDLNQDRPIGKTVEAGVLNPSVLSTVGLRRATEAPSVRVRNLTGFDIHVIPDSTPFAPESGFIPNGETCIVESLGPSTQNSPGHELTFGLRVASSAYELIGERDSVFDLPVRGSASQEARLYLLRPTSFSQSGYGRTSPEPVASEESPTSLFMALSADPVVEFCMQNQILSSSVSDVYSIPTGNDFLSASVWSPSDECYGDINDSWAGGEVFTESPDPRSPLSSHKSQGKGNSDSKSYWVKPYQGDSPEWTDMTCSVRLAPERIMLPDCNWMWVNDWKVDLSGRLGESTDADGWEYQTDFGSFKRIRRDYKRGDTCRRRRLTRTRMVVPPRLNDPNRLLRFVWDPSKDAQGNVCVLVRSHVRISNATAGSLSFYLSSPNWSSPVLVGTVETGRHIDVPVTLASAVYMMIGRAGEKIPDDDGCTSEQVLIIPTSPTSSNYVRTSIKLGDVQGTVLHCLVEIRSVRGIVDIIVEPVLRIVNLLPCLLECQIGEMLQKNDGRKADVKPVIGKRGRPITMTETMSIECGKEATFTAVNPWRKPHVSFRVPGYRWSLWQRVINRRLSTETWCAPEDEEDWHFTPRSDADYADEYKTIVHFERWTKSGDPLLIIMSVECGHCPTVRLYSQYWILDKSGFGCHFAEGFEDILGTLPDKETSRRSHLLLSDCRDSMIRKDLTIQGYEWAMGAKGMTLFFSRREKLTFSIEAEIHSNESSKSPAGPRSKWVNPLDISNVMPKTLVAVDEHRGTRCFEFAISVTMCPGIFSRTKLITLIPRYQIVNLLHRELVVAQDGCLGVSTLIPSQSSIPFHWEKGGLPPRVRLSTPFQGDPNNQQLGGRWTNGSVRLDRVGITSMRIPTDNNLTKIPFVVETEVRLATKEQPAAVVIVIWSAHEKMHSPLYSLRNTTPYTILCRQPLQSEQTEATENHSESDLGSILPESCHDKSQVEFDCGDSDVGPMILSFLGLDKIEEFVWIVRSGDFSCFGFDDPEKPHLLEWTCLTNDSFQFDDKCQKAILEVDAMGSSSTLPLGEGKYIKCRIGAEHSTKVIEFTVVAPVVSPGGRILSLLQKRGLQYQDLLKSEGVLLEERREESDEEEDVGFGVRLDLPGIQISVVDNCNVGHGREIILAEFERLMISFSQTREGYHEFELQLMSFQLDNHVQNSIHPVLVFCPPLHANEPLLHMSAVRRLQLDSNTYVF